MSQRVNDIMKDVRRYHALHAKLKPMADELERLKERFRERAGGEDTVFRYGEKEVVVTRDEKRALDSAKVEAALGAAKYEECKTLRTSFRVTARTVEAESDTPPRRRSKSA